MKYKKIYKRRQGAPFKEEDTQEIGEFIENCPDKTTKGILEEIKKHPEHKIYSLFEWDKDKAVELYQLQRVREIVSHIEVEVIKIGSSEPVELNVSLSAFKSVVPVNSTERVFVPIDEVMSNKNYREQVIERAKVELNNWIERYSQYEELEKLAMKIKKALDEED
ncbi:MAG TPA: hypothetical protein ENG48_12770 [Candidatus Atribacteria bacterium]|nr:hypothetical protein [Candidatus Atribacteria bacterium]